jgi:hypothetical protein
VAPSLMIDIGRAAGTDVSYQELVARHEHYSLVVQDGLVYSTSGLLYNIPQDSEPRATLMREVHDAPTGGHLGREKAYARLTAVYWMDSVTTMPGLDYLLCVVRMELRKSGLAVPRCLAIRCVSRRRCCVEFVRVSLGACRYGTTALCTTWIRPA